MKMKKRELSFEEEILEAYNKGHLKSTLPSKSDLRKYKESARATFIKDRRVNIRLSSPDLMDIQARAAEEGVPYQTLISSVLHKFLTGRLIEKPSRLTTRSSERVNKRRAT
jgi:predicted DNA binding CopG/RHH family protein